MLVYITVSCLFANCHMGPVLLAYARGLLSHEQGPHFVLFIYLFFPGFPVV